MGPGFTSGHPGKEKSGIPSAHETFIASDLKTETGKVNPQCLLSYVQDPWSSSEICGIPFLLLGRLSCSGKPLRKGLCLPLPLGSD